MGKLYVIGGIQLKEQAPKTALLPECASMMQIGIIIKVCFFSILYVSALFPQQPKWSTNISLYTENPEKIALVYFLRFLAFSLGRKINICND